MSPAVAERVVALRGAGVFVAVAEGVQAPQGFDASGEAEVYLGLLVNHFNAATVPGLMCRSLVSVGWDGTLYDCDFNQMLELPLGGRRRTIWDDDVLADLAGAPIATGEHCFGCTAGAGSSCGGASGG